MQSVTVERRRVRVRGQVHDVGFRPFVYGLAVELGLSGWVLRDAAGVVVDAQGPGPALDSFVRRVVSDAPATAVVDAVSVAPLDPAPGTGFTIADAEEDRKSTRLNSSHMSISYAVFCLKKKKKRHHASVTL